MKRVCEIDITQSFLLLLAVGSGAFGVSLSTGFSVAATLAAFLFLIFKCCDGWLPCISKRFPIFLMLYPVSNESVNSFCPNNSVRPAELEALIVNLLASGYAFQSTCDAIRNPIDRSVVLVFDDGLIDKYAFLFSMLKGYTVPATVFGANWGDKGLEHFFTQAHIREMAAPGLIEFGGDAVSHIGLSTVSPKTALQEIWENYAISELWDKSLCFVHPYTDETIEFLKAIGYSYAFTMHKETRSVVKDPGRCHRQITPRGKKPLESYLIATCSKSWI